MRGRHYGAIAAVVVIAVLALAGCSSSPGKSSSTSSDANAELSRLTLDYASAGDSDSEFKAIGDNVVSSANKLGLKIGRYDNNLDGPTAVSNARLIAQSHPDVAIDFNVVANLGNAIGAQFKSAGVKCIALVIPISGCPLFTDSAEASGVQNADVVATYARQRGWTSANTTIVLSTSFAAGPVATDVTSYFYMELAKDLGGFKKVTLADITPSTTTIGGTNGLQINCNSSLSDAYTAMRNAIGTLRKGNNIILEGDVDDCALGAYQALQQGGFGAHILIAGNAASPQGLEALRTNPNWVAENSQFTTSWGPYLMSLAAALQAGATVPAVTTPPQVSLTKADLSTYYNSSGDPIGQLPPLSAGDQYLAKYGILQKLVKIKGLNS